MAELKIEYVKTDTLQAYANNAKEHPAEQVEQIKKSIEQFGFNDPIAIWHENEVIEGHGRLIAATELGLEEVPVIRLDDLTDEQRRAYMLVHNKLTMNSDFNLDLLAMELDDITNIDMADFGFDLGLDDQFELSDYGDSKEHQGNLEKNYIVPPFSVLDARQGYWQDRKAYWLEKTGDLSETRNEDYGKFTSDGGFVDSINDGTSNFDPVLAEVMMKWFCMPGGRVLDPFGGEQTKGVVAGELGLTYRGCEIRQDQVDLNNKCTKEYPDVRYYCGDSNNISEIIEDREFDMCFTSPPYYDLEVYSAEDMSALGSYEEFMAMYRNIFQQCYDMLADDSFLVIKVGEIRDKKTGNYRGFVNDNIHMFMDIGFKYYNEIILVTAVGTAPLRANRAMKHRKVVKTHQNVLVFYKGDTKNIPHKYPRLVFDDLQGDEEEE